MPTHVHMIVEDFVDLPCSTIMKHVKGDTSRVFFATFPELRPDLLGGHLWTKGYYAVGIVSMLNSWPRYNMCIPTANAPIFSLRCP